MHHAKVLLLGGLLIGFPWVPLSWVLRLLCLGWLLELVERQSRPGEALAYPSFRRPWQHIKRGWSFLWRVGLLLLPASYLLATGWRNGWIVSFEHVPDYRASGALTVLSGMLLVALLAPALPALTVALARVPRLRSLDDLLVARHLVGMAPVTYGLAVAGSFVPWIPLELARPLVLEFPGLVFFGVLSFGFALATKLAWARWYRRAARVAAEVEAGTRPAPSPWWFRLMVPFYFAAGVGYALAILMRQFAIWESEGAWFAHWLFLLPGTPAPLSEGPQVYW